jgi:hypothetical protein
MTYQLKHPRQISLAYTPFNQTSLKSVLLFLRLKYKQLYSPSIIHSFYALHVKKEHAERINSHDILQNISPTFTESRKNYEQPAKIFNSETSKTQAKWKCWDVWMKIIQETIITKCFLKQTTKIVSTNIACNYSSNQFLFPNKTCMPTWLQNSYTTPVVATILTYQQAMLHELKEDSTQCEHETLATTEIFY